VATLVLRNIIHTLKKTVPVPSYIPVGSRFVPAFSTLSLELASVVGTAIDDLVHAKYHGALEVSLRDHKGLRSLSLDQIMALFPDWKAVKVPPEATQETLAELRGGKFARRSIKKSEVPAPETEPVPEPDLEPESPPTPVPVPEEVVEDAAEETVPAPTATIDDLLEPEPESEDILARSWTEDELQAMKLSSLDEILVQEWSWQANQLHRLKNKAGRVAEILRLQAERA
jgi:hypothetical protein